jgi:hypothetical protein
VWDSHECAEFRHGGWLPSRGPGHIPMWSRFCLKIKTNFIFSYNINDGQVTHQFIEPDFIQCNSELKSAITCAE